jgi:hypothetical protein
MRDTTGKVGQHILCLRVRSEEIGCDRKYETMVFFAGERCTAKGCGCGLPSIRGSEMDCEGSNDAGTATKNHMAMCNRYSRIAAPKED